MLLIFGIELRHLPDLLVVKNARELNYPGEGPRPEPLAGPQARHTERHAALTPWPLLSCLGPSCLPGGARPLADYQRRGSGHWIAARIIGVRKQHFSETKKREVDPLNNYCFDKCRKSPMRLPSMTTWWERAIAQTHKLKHFCTRCTYVKLVG